MFRVLDLFSGIGGFSLGLERTGGFKTVAFCEIDRRKASELERHWPGIPCFPDVEALSGYQVEGGADIICGGFPCQDISSAGRRAGLAGERSGLWFHFSRLIGDLRPKYVIVENVPALLVRGMGDILGDLAGYGYDAEWHCVPAAALGAPHLRARVWILAYPRGLRKQAHDTVCPRWSEPFVCDRWLPEPGASFVDDGLPRWMANAYGDSLIPQIPELIGRAILQAEKEMNP